MPIMTDDQIIKIIDDPKTTELQVLELFEMCVAARDMCYTVTLAFRQWFVWSGNDELINFWEGYYERGWSHEHMIDVLWSLQSDFRN